VLHLLNRISLRVILWRQRFQDKKEAPAFTLNCLDGKRITSAITKGSQSLVTFWRHLVCVLQRGVTHIRKILDREKGSIGPLLITIGRGKKEGCSKIIEEITHPSCPLLLKEKCMDQYGVRGWVPQTFLIDQEGMLVGKT